MSPIPGAQSLCTTIRPERSTDAQAIREIHRAAFGQDAEARLVDALRQSGDARLSLVAEAEDAPGSIVGHVLYCRLDLLDSDLLDSEGDPQGVDGIQPQRNTESLALAPLAVLPSWQRRGIGSQLVREGLEICRSAGYGSVIVLGFPQYYCRFGFSVKLAARFECVYAGEHLMALELMPGGLPRHGRIEYPGAFGDL